ncbi:hypothetical protein F2P81_008060 [Scophthalmus maximus]|uniref:Uncharacterized protein n=1 Tax=Scophthalmus maximus TaxID=52904 RepID=A0A6A4T3W9_SCOMX|nr:hypothetical protein F2P81_008060 [Scophthalmus maximus]
MSEKWTTALYSGGVSPLSVGAPPPLCRNAGPALLTLNTQQQQQQDREPLRGRQQGCADKRRFVWWFFYNIFPRFKFILTANMELDRRLLSAHCAVHALSIAAGLLVVVPMALNGSAFKGRCALFSTGYWRAETRGADTEPSADASHLVVQQWGPLAACQFATFVGIFTVLYGAAQSWRGFFYLHGRHDDCAESQSVPLYLDVDTSSFYTELSLAQKNCCRLSSCDDFDYDAVCVDTAALRALMK